MRQSVSRSAPRTAVRRSVRGRLVAIAALAVAAAVVPLPNTPAAEAVVGLQLVGLDSARDSSTYKEVFVPCPRGTSGLGGGAVVGSQAKIVGIVPSATGVRVLATELIGGTSAAWRLEGVATCAPTSSLPGLDYETDTVRSQGSSGEQVGAGATARCVGKQIIGMGGWLPHASGPANPPQERLNLTMMLPSITGQHQVSVRGVANGLAGPFDVSATAVCVDSAPGLRVVSSPYAEDADQVTESPAVGCPENTQLHAAGFNVSYRTDSVGPHAYATTVAPFIGGGLFNAGVAVIAQRNGTDLVWGASANGICAS